MSAHSKGPTLEQLHAVWLKRNKARWPPTFEEAMKHEVFSRVLKIRALYVDLQTIRREVQAPEKPISSPVTNIDRSGHKVGWWMDTDDD